MKLPIGIIKGKELEKIFSESIQHHLGVLYEVFDDYEPLKLFRDWNTFIRSIDEFINIRGELRDAALEARFLSLKFDFLNKYNVMHLGSVIQSLQKKYGRAVANRFKCLALMCGAIQKAYTDNGVFAFIGANLNLSNAFNSVGFLQSRRLYYVTLLQLIPNICKGAKQIKEIDLLNFFQYRIDSCLTQVTTAYHYLLMNETLPDFEVRSDGTTGIANFEYIQLEDFFLDPQRLSLIDQLDLRPERVRQIDRLHKNNNTLFSFSEVTNTMSSMQGAYHEYKIDEQPVFKALHAFLSDIEVYVVDDFNVVIPWAGFNIIAAKYPILKLNFAGSNYFEALKTDAPFQFSDGNYHSTVVLLCRYVHNTLSSALQKIKRFQIHAGFVFEDKVKKILVKQGFACVDRTTRIKRQEFDLVTIKNNKVFNFQCKNNFLDITRINNDYKKIGRLIRGLCGYYEASLIKEINRQHLLQEKTGIMDIEHYIVSRFPVITRNARIINFNDLEKRLPGL